MNLTPQEIASLYLWLEEYGKQMPSARTYQPYYNASSWDLNDLFSTFRDDAVQSGYSLWECVLKRDKLGRWPKMKTSAAFWLRERWSMAEWYCRRILEDKCCATKPIKAVCPQNLEASAKWLLVDLWDDYLVDFWIRENARSYVFADDYKAEDSRMELEIYLRKLERS